MCKNLPAQMELDFIRLYQVSVLLNRSMLLLFDSSSNTFVWLCYILSSHCSDSLIVCLILCLTLPLANTDSSSSCPYAKDVTDDSHSIGCSTQSHPTADFIKGHADRYVDWSPYKGSLSVNSEFIPITLCSLAILLLISVFAYLRWNFLVEYFSPRYSFSRGYTGIPDDSRTGPRSTSIQMTWIKRWI